MLPVKALAELVLVASSGGLLLEEVEAEEEPGALSSCADMTDERGEFIDQMGFQPLSLGG